MAKVERNDKDQIIITDKTLYATYLKARSKALLGAPEDLWDNDFASMDRGIEVCIAIALGANGGVIASRGDAEILTKSMLLEQIAVLNK